GGPSVEHRTQPAGASGSVPAGDGQSATEGTLVRVAAPKCVLERPLREDRGYHGRVVDERSIDVCDRDLASNGVVLGLPPEGPMDDRLAWGRAEGWSHGDFQGTLVLTIQPPGRGASPVRRDGVWPSCHARRQLQLQPRWRPIMP